MHLILALRLCVAVAVEVFLFLGEGSPIFIVTWLSSMTIVSPTSTKKVSIRCFVAMYIYRYPCVDLNDPHSIKYII